MPHNEFRSFSDMWLHYVREYKSKSYTPFHVTFPWDSEAIKLVWSISEGRCRKRLNSYLIPGELERARTSVRFGHEKPGRGYQTQRGDFCLLAGSIKSGHLTLHYRSLELIGGLHFDLPVWDAVNDAIGPVKKVSIFAAYAFVFGVRGNKSMTKERLYGQVNEYHRTGLQAHSR
jgi:hypothetical protein